MGRAGPHAQTFLEGFHKVFGDTSVYAERYCAEGGGAFFLHSCQGHPDTAHTSTQEVEVAPRLVCECGNVSRLCFQLDRQSSVPGSASALGCCVHIAAHANLHWATFPERKTLGPEGQTGIPLCGPRLAQKKKNSALAPPAMHCTHKWRCDCLVHYASLTHTHQHITSALLRSDRALHHRSPPRRSPDSLRTTQNRFA